MAVKKKRAKSKSRRSLVALISPVTGHRRLTTKNSLNTPDKLNLSKYDPIARRVVIYKETNKNLGRNEVKPRKK